MAIAAQGRLTHWTVRLVYLQQRAGIGLAARLILWMFGIDIPAQVRIAPGLRLSHPTVGLVVHPSTKIGQNVTLFHGVTLGRTDAWLPEPPSSRSVSGIEVCAGAVIGAGAVVLFKSGHRLIIGEGAIVGANAVVTSDVPAGEVWVGNPACRVNS